MPMEECCEKLGIKATDEEKMAMLQQVKAKSLMAHTSGRSGAIR